MPTFTFRFDGTIHEVTVDGAHVVVDGESFDVAINADGRNLRVQVGGRTFAVEVPPSLGPSLAVQVNARPHAVELEARAARPPAIPAPMPHQHHQGAHGAVPAPMPGTIVRVLVQPGDAVEAGDLLLTLDAMKMENEIRAPHRGRVQRVAIAIGQRVAQGALLVAIG